jgi:hypothetical protein
MSLCEVSRGSQLNFVCDVYVCAGYTNRFGLHYVDYTNGAKRYKKDSVAWYTNWIQQQKMLTMKEKESQKAGKGDHLHKSVQIVLTEE